MQDDSSTRSWDSIADDWVAHADSNDYRNHLLMPLMLEMLGDVSGAKVLDLGCGEGGYSRELARRGATVTGVDGSARLIEVARERAVAERVKVTFLCANANRLAGIEDRAFDLAVASMSLMDVKDYAGAISEAHRVLAPGGELLMSITHPCFSAPLSQWERSGPHEWLHFKVDRYLERTAWETKITADFRNTVTRRHRPLEDYMAEPIKKGFVLKEFREPGATPEQMAKSRRFAKLNRIPYFLFMRWKKS